VRGDGDEPAAAVGQPLDQLAGGLGCGVGPGGVGALRVDGGREVVARTEPRHAGRAHAHRAGRLQEVALGHRVQRELGGAAPDPHLVPDLPAIAASVAGSTEHHSGCASMSGWPTVAMTETGATLALTTIMAGIRVTTVYDDFAHDAGCLSSVRGPVPGGDDPRRGPWLRCADSVPITTDTRVPVRRTAIERGAIGQNATSCAVPRPFTTV
jgi:hypothetical protein